MASEKTSLNKGGRLKRKGEIKVDGKKRAKSCCWRGKDNDKKLLQQTEERRTP